MRTLKITLLLTTILLAQTTFSQEFQVPDTEFATKDDYTRAEKDVLAATKWLYSVPMDQQVSKRKEALAFVMKWLTGTPAVTVELSAGIAEVCKKNPEFLIMFMASCSQYALENNYSKDSRAMQAFALKEIVAYYKAGNGTEKDKKMDKVVKAQDEGKLDEWIDKNLKIKS